MNAPSQSCNWLPREHVGSDFNSWGFGRSQPAHHESATWSLGAIQPLEVETRWILKPRLAQILKSAFTQDKKISPNPLANTQNPLKLVIVES